MYCTLVVYSLQNKELYRFPNFKKPVDFFQTKTLFGKKVRVINESIEHGKSVIKVSLSN